MGKRGPRRSKTKPKARRTKAAPGRRGKARARKRAPAIRRRRREGGDPRGRASSSLLRDLTERHETGPAASAGDLDADWQRAQSSGEEAVGGSVATPDQDVVDEIGHALGVEHPMQAPLRSSEEILRDRDQRYWELDRRAARKAGKRRQR